MIVGRKHALRLSKLKKREKKLRAQIVAQEARNLRLEALLEQERSNRIIVEKETQIGAFDEDDADEDYASEQEVPEALWDDKDGVFRCPSPDCMCEVVGAQCEGCWKTVTCKVESVAEYSWRFLEEDNYKRKFETCAHSQVAHSDRSHAPRGATPLLSLSPPSEPLPDYEPDEYHALLQRGATPLMCEISNLRYTPEEGIYASADPALYTDFSGPDMLRGHEWKTHLGRYIKLDREDKDGTGFIEGLLEDAVVFPLYHHDRELEAWITEQEEPGVWVTRRTSSRPDMNHANTIINSHAEEPLVLRDDYEEEGTEMHDSEADDDHLEDSSKRGGGITNEKKLDLDFHVPLQAGDHDDEMSGNVPGDIKIKKEQDDDGAEENEQMLYGDLRLLSDSEPECDSDSEDGMSSGDESVF